MWPMKYPHLAKQKYGNPASCTLFDFRAKFNEQGFNIAPLDVCARGAGKNQFNNPLVLPLHGRMVPLSGTACVYRRRW
jgi:hypothetical protein